MSDLVERLRRNPVICMDKQNITSDAADEIERLRRVEEQNNNRIAELEAAQVDQQLHWVRYAYMHLGMVRDRMSDDDVGVVQRFLGPLSDNG